MEKTLDIEQKKREEISPTDKNSILTKEDNITERRKSSDLLNDVIKFWIVLFLIMGSAVGIFYIINRFSLDNNEFYFHLFWYPLAFVCILVWVKGIKKDKLRPYLLHKPKFPEKHHRWFYIVYSIFFISFVALWVILLNKGSSYAYIDYPMPLLIVSLTHSCIGAPVVEEILFRGYWYKQSEKVWGKDGWYINWNSIELNSTTKQMNERKIMKFEITYAAIFSSLLFGIWHLNVIQAIYTFFGGLFFVKTKREWGETLIAPMILHSTWNFMAQILVITNLPILETIFNWIISLI